MKAIPKLQQGGFAGLFANYTPIYGAQPRAQQPQQRASAPSSRDRGNDGKLTEKDLFELMKDVKGLPNDMAALVKNLYEMYTVQIATGDTQNLAAIYLQNLMQLKNNVFNQEAYNKAYEQVKAQGGLNEYAITTDGKLVVQDMETKELMRMTAEKLKDSTNDNLQVLTNSDLLSLRANSPSLVNDNSILQIVENGIGMEQIAKMVQERLQSLGTDETEYKGQTVRVNGKLEAGAEILGALADDESTIFDGSTKLEGLHSWELLTKTQQRQARYALRWIINSLPNNAKTLLSIKAGGDKNVEGLIMSLIQSRTNETRHVSTDFKKTWDDLTGSKNSKGQDSKDSMGDVKYNTASEWLKGYGVLEQFIINPGSNNAFSVITNGLQLTSSKNDPLGAGKTLQDITAGGYSGILNMSQATMGGRRIKQAVLNQIFIEDGMIYSIDFPVMPDGITPDLRDDTLQRKKQAEKTIEAYGIDLKNPDSIRANFSTINQVYKSFGFGDHVYNSDGSINQRSWRRFGVINARADGRTLQQPTLENNKLLSPITDDYEINALKTEMKKIDKNYGFDDDDWGLVEGDYDSFYRGTVWIPVRESFIAAQAGTGDKFTSQTGLQMNIQDQYLKLGSQAAINLNITTKQPR